MKQVVTNYSFSTSAKTVTLSDFGATYPVDLKRLYLITDVTINAILYNFADSTVASATVTSNNVVTLSTLTGSASNGDSLQIVYEAKSTDPIYETPLLASNASQETGGNLASIATSNSTTATNTTTIAGAVSSSKMNVAGTVTITNPLVTGPLVGQSKIATTGTAVQLNGGTSQVLTNGIIISAPSSNVASISIGGSSVNNTTGGTGNGYLLVPGASVSFAMVNTNDIYINGTSGDYVSWAGS